MKKGLSKIPIRGKAKWIFHDSFSFFNPFKQYEKFTNEAFMNSTIQRVNKMRERFITSTDFSTMNFTEQVSKITKSLHVCFLCLIHDFFVLFCDLPCFFLVWKKSFHFENDYEWNPISFEIWHPWCQFCGQFCMHFGVKIEIYYIKWLCIRNFALPSPNSFKAQEFFTK